MPPSGPGLGKEEAPAAAKPEEPEVDKPEPGSTSLRDRILRAKDIRTEDVPCEDWDNVVVQVKTLTGVERAEMYEKYMDRETGQLDLGKVTPAIVIAASFDPATGKRVFVDEDIGPLNEKSSAMLEKVGKVALRLSGMTDDSKKEAQGNSKSTPSDASTSS